MTIRFLSNRHGPGPFDKQRGRCRAQSQQSSPHRTVAQSFEITVHRLAINAVIIRVGGDIDMLTAPRLAAEIARQLRSGARVLVLDLRDVSFLSGSGVRTLLSGREAAQRSKTVLCLLYETAVVSRPLSVLGLTDLFHTPTDLFNIARPHEPVLSDPERRQG